MAKSVFGLVHRLMSDAGLIEPGATVEFYDAGTTTPRTVYSDRALSTTAGSSVTADANGVCPERWVADSIDLKLIYKDASGATKYTRDYFNDSLNSALLASLAGLTGTAGYFPRFTSATVLESYDLNGTAQTWTAPQIWGPTGNLGSTAGDEEVIGTFATNDDNNSFLIVRGYRLSNGSSNGTHALEIRRKTDNSNHSHMRLTATALQIGYNGTSHWEFDSNGHLKPLTDSSYDLGTDAFRVRVLYGDDIELRPSASRTPASNGDLSIEATSNTTLTFKFKGSDGTVRSGSVTLS